MLVSYLLDTTVFSDLLKCNAESVTLQDWFTTNLERSFLSDITLHELWFGVERLAVRKSMESRNRAIRLRVYYAALIHGFSGRVLSADSEILKKAAAIRARVEVTLHDIQMADAMIAATAVTYNLVVATRNVGDFAATGASVLDTRLISAEEDVQVSERDARSPTHLQARIPMGMVQPHPTLNPFRR